MAGLTVSSIRHIIGLQWNVEVKDMLPDSTSQECSNPSDAPEKIIRCAECRIEGMEHSIFHLELTNQLTLTAKGHCSWPYRIIYAFAVVKDRAFLVQGTDKLKFLDILEQKHLDSVEEATFHCLVLVGPTSPSSTSATPNRVGKEGLPAEEQVCADVIVGGHLYSKFDGEIPEFTSDKAKELIRAEDTNDVLKVLAMEYLKKNIEPKNVSDILKLAIDQDLKVLQKACSEFLSGCIIRQKNLLSYYSSDSESVSDESDPVPLYPVITRTVSLFEVIDQLNRAEFSL